MTTADHMTGEVAVAPGWTLLPVARSGWPVASLGRPTTSPRSPRWPGRCLPVRARATTPRTWPCEPPTPLRRWRTVHRPGPGPPRGRGGHRRPGRCRPAGREGRDRPRGARAPPRAAGRAVGRGRGVPPGVPVAPGRPRARHRTRRRRVGGRRRVGRRAPGRRRRRPPGPAVATLDHVAMGPAGPGVGDHAPARAPRCRPRVGCRRGRHGGRLVARSAVPRRGRAGGRRHRRQHRPVADRHRGGVGCVAPSGAVPRRPTSPLSSTGSPPAPSPRPPTRRS